MKTNVEKVLERDQKLSELDDRAGKVGSWSDFLDDCDDEPALKFPKSNFFFVCFQFLF